MTDFCKDCRFYSAADGRPEQLVKGKLYKPTCVRLVEQREDAPVYLVTGERTYVNNQLCEIERATHYAQARKALPYPRQLCGPGALYFERRKEPRETRYMR